MAILILIKLLQVLLLVGVLGALTFGLYEAGIRKIQFVLSRPAVFHAKRLFGLRNAALEVLAVPRNHVRAEVIVPVAKQFRLSRRQAQFRSQCRRAIRSPVRGLKR